MEITRGKIPCAKKVVIYGPEGIGKSTFASQFPEPVFIDTEGSTNSMDVARLPKPTSWQMLLDEIQYIKSHPDVCKTLVIDTIIRLKVMIKVEMYMYLKMVQRFRSLMECVFLFRKIWNQITRL